MSIGVFYSSRLSKLVKIQVDKFEKDATKSSEEGKTLSLSLSLLILFVSKRNHKCAKSRIKNFPFSN